MEVVGEIPTTAKKKEFAINTSIITKIVRQPIILLRTNYFSIKIALELLFSNSKAIFLQNTLFCGITYKNNYICDTNLNLYYSSILL